VDLLCVAPYGEQSKVTYGDIHGGPSCGWACVYQRQIYKAAAMAELRNHDVWRLLMPSEMMVCVHDGDGSIARVLVKKEMVLVLCV
jgi:hypothetical protein